VTREGSEATAASHLSRCRRRACSPGCSVFPCRRRVEQGMAGSIP
jgi:hypothetical protein